MKNKHLSYCAAMVAASTITGQAALVTWGGAGSSGSPAFWNQPGTGSGQNGDVTHWGQANPPTVDGTDNVVMNGGGINKNSGITWANGSDFTMNSGAYFRYNSGDMVVRSTVALNNNSTIQINGAGLFVSNSATGNVTVSTGSSVNISTGYFNTTGGTIDIAGGLLLSAGAQTNPVRATTGLGSARL